MSIDKLKTNLGTGARPNKYKVYIVTPSAGDETKYDVLAKATSLPEKSIGVVEVFSQGRKLPLAGDETFTQTWDVTFYNDATLSLRADIEAWMTSIDDTDTHTRSKESVTDYVQTLKVEQLSGANAAVATYEIYNAWPSNISAVDLADDANDTVSEFTVTFSFSHWVRTA